MINGVVLIIITMLAVLGAYYLCEALTEVIYAPKKGSAILFVVCEKDASMGALLHHVRMCAQKGQVCIISHDTTPPLVNLPSGVRVVSKTQAVEELLAFLQETMPSSVSFVPSMKEK